MGFPELYVHRAQVDHSPKFFNISRYKETQIQSSLVTVYAPNADL